MTTGPDIQATDAPTQTVRVDTNESDWASLAADNGSAAPQISDELAEIIGDLQIDWNRGDDGEPEVNELIGIIDALLTGEPGNQPGLDGVTLVSVSDGSFVLAFAGADGSVHQIEFTGWAAEQAIDHALSGADGEPGIDLTNEISEVTVFDTDADADGSVAIGSAEATSDEFAQIVSGSTLELGEAEDLLEAMISAGAHGEGSGEPGVDGVRLAGLTEDGFALQIEGEAGTTDTIIFKGIGAQEMIANAEAAFTAQGNVPSGEPTFHGAGWFDMDDANFGTFGGEDTGESYAHHANSNIVDDADEFGFIKNNDVDIGDDFGFI